MSTVKPKTKLTDSPSDPQAEEVDAAYVSIATPPRPPTSSLSTQDTSIQIMSNESTTTLPIACGGDDVAPAAITTPISGEDEDVDGEQGTLLRDFHVVSRDRAPSWSLEDYPFLQRGFIAPHYPTHQCLYSLVRPTNETTNVYSQLVGLSVFIWCLVTTFTNSKNNEDDHDNVETELVWLRICLGTDLLVCLASSTCHLLQSKSQHHHDVLSVGDWGSILVVTLASAGAFDFTSACPDEFPGLYHFIGSVAIAVLFIAYLTWKSTGTTHLFRFGGMIVIAVLQTAPPITAIVIKSGSDNLRNVFFSHVPVGVGCFLLGGAFFSSHFPERTFPSVFDICLQSHTLWHIFYQVGLFLLHSFLARAMIGHVPWY
eukprot:PhM_4_TR4922/c0_g1_i1/m.51003/K07297/ADIPOR; adiponectin receptor